MKINGEAVDAIAELKGWHCDLTDARFACKHEETTKKVGEHVGRIYSEEMKALVMSSKETNITKPDCPKGDSVTEEKKAVWSKEHDQCVKKHMKCQQDKAKAYEVVWGRCTEAMKNRIEKLGSCEPVEENNDIVELLKAIKQQVFHANEKKHPSLRMAMVWKKLCGCR